MTDFRALCAELLQELEHANDWDYQQALKDQARAALTQPEPEEPTDEELNSKSSPNNLQIRSSDLTEEVIRIDKEGFHYRGQFIADAGEAHQLMIKFLKQNTI
jgi:hypothetical protein